MKKNIIVLAFITISYVFNSCSSGGDDSPIIEDTFSISLSSSSLSFGDLIINTTKSEDFTITNTGNQTINITGVSVPDGFALSATSATITPGSSKTITVTFSPTEVKSYSGTITVSLNSTGPAKSLSVTGNGTSSDTFTTSLSSTSLSFGDLTINTTKNEDFTITNTGNQDIEITNITAPDGFSVSASTAIITPGNSTTITVTFSPTEVKAYSGTINITSNSTSPDNSVSVTGNGTAVDTFTTSLSSTSLSFGDLSVNTTKNEDFTITNTGNQNIDVTNITAPDGFSVSATTATITPGNSTTITVTFSPTEVKAYNGTINITSNSTSPDNSVNVTGNGTAVVTPPTYAINIAPIINGKCLSCHSNPPVNGAPMSLTTYTNVKNAVETRGLIGRVESGSMPKNGTPLTAEQVQLIKDWKDAGYIE